MQRFDREDDEPLDPAVERVRQKMARLQLVSLSIMLAGIFAVFAVIIYKVWYEPEDEVAAASTDAVAGATASNLLESSELQLPENALVLQSDLSGNRILLRLNIAGSTELWIYDLVAGQVLSKVKLAN